MSDSPLRKSATVTLNTRNQNAESIQAVVNSILGRAGCSHCGRIAILAIELAGDPPPELSKAGVISVQVE
jgi:hypothetical protein